MMSQAAKQDDSNASEPVEGRRTWLAWDDPDRPAGNGPANFPKWLVPLAGAAWVGWVVFLAVMLGQR